jgi:predicted Zn-dependent protease
MLRFATPLDYEFRLPEVSMGYPVENVAESLKKVFAEQRAIIFDRMLKIAVNDVLLFGYVSDNVTENVVMSSNGTFLYQSFGGVSFNVVAMNESASGYASGVAKSYEELSVDEKVERAVRFAKMSRNPVEIDPGSYTVVLGPEAVSDLFMYFGWLCTNGYTHELKISPSAKYLGTKIGPNELNVYDDPTHPMQLPFVYDLCGKKREKTAIIENGVFKNVFYAHGAALRFNKKPTGHTFSLDDLDSAVPVNLVVDAGTMPVEEMIKGTKSGIYVNRFHYMNIVDPQEAIFTGMTRDGTFIIENGQLTKALKNMRFNVKFFEFTQNIEAISKEVESVASEYFPQVAPYMKVQSFNFTSKTA